jgi:hypothetical protein
MALLQFNTIESEDLKLYIFWFNMFFLCCQLQLKSIFSKVKIQYPTSFVL